MLSPKPISKASKSFSLTTREPDASSELKFITELGRSLLVMVHPKKVASRVAEAVCRETRAGICVVVVELEQIGLVSGAFASENGAARPDILQRRRFEKWLEILPPQILVWTENDDKYLLKDEAHAFEYVSPLHINGEVKGAVIVGFSSKKDCSETAKRLIDAATQMAAMSINLSAHYESAINTSINQAREEHRKFTESVLDSLPVSIYVIDRDYKIVTWNRQREIGGQGMPREEVIGRNVFQVFAKYPQNRLKQEFERAFCTGNIERLEQQTVDQSGATQHWMVSKIPMRDETTGEVTHVITVGEDVTMRVEAIHAAGRAEKLAAVGRLAAGVVHEINNPLATISACAESLEARVDEGVFGHSAEVDDLHEYLCLIRSEAFRCKAITNGLLDFSRVRTSNRSMIDVPDLIKSSANLISHQKRGANIKIKFELDGKLPRINADGGQLQQA